MDKISSLTIRQKKLIDYILKNQNGKTLKEIMQYFNLSQRTVRAEIHDINKTINCDLIFCIRNVGYFVNQEILLKINSITINFQSYENKLRIYKILNYLLKKNKYSLNDLADKIYVSYSTLRKVIIDFNKSFNNDLIVIHRGYCFFNDDLLLRRRLFFRLFKRLVKESKEDLDNIISTLFYQNAIEDILQIETNNINIASSLGMIFNKIDSRVLSICIYFCFNLNKLETKLFVANNSLNDQYSDFLNLLKVDYSQLKNVDFVVLNELISSFCFKNNEDISISPLTEVIFEEFAIDVFEKYSLNIYNSKILADNFFKHIEYMLKRVKNNFQTYNPFLNEIKTNYPYAYEISLLLIHIVYRYLNFYMNEHEISYIALYVEYFLINEDKKVKAVLISNQRKSLENLYVSFIKQHFINQLDIVTICREEELSNYLVSQQVDLVLSLSEIECPIEKYIFNALPTNVDVSRLKNIIHNIKYCYRLKNVLSKLIKPELIYFLDSSDSLMEIFNLVGKDLKKYNYIDNMDLFVADLIEREKYYPSNLTNDLMIPHGLKYFSNQNCVSVVVLKKPLNSVKLIFILALTNKRSDDINVLYDVFKIMANNTVYRGKMYNCSNESDFMNVLLNIPKTNSI